MLKNLLFFLLMIASPLLAQVAPAQSGLNPIVQAVGESLAATPADRTNPPLVTKLAVLAGLSLLPFAIMLLTSFMKIVVVLSLFRQALGVQQTPPNQVISGIALLITIYVMSHRTCHVHCSPRCDPRNRICSSDLQCISLFCDQRRRQSQRTLKEILREKFEPKTYAKFLSARLPNFP